METAVNSQRNKQPVHFQPFQPDLRPVEKLDQQTKQKRFFSQDNKKKKNNQPEMIDPNRRRSTLSEAAERRYIYR